MNWPALISIGLGQLRLSPDAFWAMTPREFIACTGGFAQSAPMSRDTLDCLLAQHPDTAHD